MTLKIDPACTSCLILTDGEGQTMEHDIDSGTRGAL